MIFRRWRLTRAGRRPFPPEWRAILERALPRVARLADRDRATLERLIRVFLAGKRFEGAAGLRVTDEMRLTIAAQACLLVLATAADPYPDLFSIIVYPHEYLAAQRVRDPVGVVSEGLQVRQGETAARGAVVLSWDAARAGAAGPNGGRNVVFHEFAHLLDAESGGFDGAPPLGHAGAVQWSRTMRAAFHALEADVAAGVAGALDPYAASSPAEFFAVATERFFQDPHGMAADLPDVFRLLSAYYRQDSRASTEDASPAR